MSNVSDCYDAFVARIEAVLPNHTRLSNPYEIEQNIEPLMIQGWGLGMGASTNTNRELSCRVSIRRQFSLVLTRKFYALEADAESKASTEKELLEDQLLVIKDLCSNSDLSGLIGVVDFESDGGIEQVYGEKDQFLALRSTFTAEIWEQA
jgi:hypothetical protein